jgi:hypothetical protein
MTTAPGDFFKEISRGNSHTAGRLRQEEKMKIIFGMLGVLMLTLLPLPLEAKDIYMAVLSEYLVTGAGSLDNLDVLIRTNSSEVDHYFQNGNLILQHDQALIIRGGRGSIGRELDQYPARNIILNNPMNWQNLDGYGCYKKRPLGRENTTYVIVRSSDAQWNGGWCTKSLLNSTGTTINVGQLSAKAKVIPQN